MIPGIGDDYRPKKKASMQDDSQNKSNEQQQPPSFKHGGKVHRTGVYKLHRGEMVIPSRMAQRFAEARR